MDIEILIDRLEHYLLEDSPKFLGNRVINDDEVRGILAQLRQAVPQEVRESQRIVREKQQILEQARMEAEQIIATGRVEKEKMVSEHLLAKDARKQAQRIVAAAEREAQLLRDDADAYVFDTLSQLQAELTRNLHVVENGLQKLEAAHEKTLDNPRALTQPPS